MIDQIAAHVSVSMLPGIGPAKSRKILDSLTSLESFDVYSTVLKCFPSIEIGHSEWHAIWSRSVDKVERIMDQGIVIVPYLSDLYPANLRGLSTPPVNLYLIGRVDSLLSANIIAIVGTRNPDSCIQDFAPSFCEHLSSLASCVVSGLALGCDSMAHIASIRSTTPTVAVLPCGIDKIYPKENQGSAQDIVEAGGCLVSEYEPGTKIQKSYFVARDRIQAGLSHAGVLLQSSLNGGSMHAMKTLASLGRPLATISPPMHLLNADQWAGNVKLINGRPAPLVFDLASDAHSIREGAGILLPKHQNQSVAQSFIQQSLL